MAIQDKDSILVWESSSSGPAAGVLGQAGRRSPLPYAKQGDKRRQWCILLLQCLGDSRSPLSLERFGNCDCFMARSRKVSDIGELLKLSCRKDSRRHELPKIRLGPSGEGHGGRLYPMQIDCMVKEVSISISFEACDYIFLRLKMLFCLYDLPGFLWSKSFFL